MPLARQTLTRYISLWNCSREREIIDSYGWVIMSGAQKFYYWANLIVNPIALIFLFSGNQILSYFTVGWVIVSGILDPWVRSLIAGFIKWLLAAIVWFLASFIAFICAGAIVALVVAIILVAVASVIASVAALIGVVVALAYLWVNALVAIRQDAQLMIRP